MEDGQNYFEASFKEKNSQCSEALSNLFNELKRIDEVFDFLKRAIGFIGIFTFFLIFRTTFFILYFLKQI